MTNGSYFVDSRAIEGHQFIASKAIAKITFCGAFIMDVYDCMNWNPPTPEQIKNLKEMLNIDVKLIGEDDDEEK